MTELSTSTKNNEISLNSRNVIDYYKLWQHDEIVADLDKKRNPFVNVCMNLTGDFSKSSIIRNANAWLAKETWIVGRKRFDARGTVGTHRYEKVKHSTDWQEVFAYLKKDGYTIYAVDNIPEYEPKVLYNISMPEKSAFVYGEEGVGLPAEVIEACDEMIYIPQYGSVRSINVAVAAGVIMNEWVRQHNPIIELS
jgi:tRNA G18 (ribose-2'-O)-methylase SpoU